MSTRSYVPPGPEVDFVDEVRVRRVRRSLVSPDLAVALAETFSLLGDPTRTRILHAGTRSEGRIGRLFHKGVELPGRTPGESIDVTTAAANVRFTYMGEARPHLWSISGWTDRAVPR